MQQIIPLIPHCSSKISEMLHVSNENGYWIYFHGGLPIISHKEDDIRMFRMITSSFINEGNCKNKDIQKVFNVSKSSVTRNLKKYQESGSKGFLSSKATRGSSTVLTPIVIKKIEELLYDGYIPSEIARDLNINLSTLTKGISSGRIKKIVKVDKIDGTNKSERSVIDSQEANNMGVACTRSNDRTLAAFGLLRLAETRFENCYDVTNGGVLTALPALSLNGLYHEIDQVFEEFTGYYSMIQVLTLLAFMSLSRIKTIEKLGQQPPGEMGKLLGLDRMPGVKCLRDKLSELSEDERGAQWGELLSKKWMEDHPDLSGALYIDGHVRLYAGKEPIPKQYVSRERLCLRGMMDFWVNDMLGQPFFVVRKDINPGMISTLRDDIVPKLLKDIPNQPSTEELENNPYLHRFILVFDREGYSPVFFKEMWSKHRIACMTYHKYPKDDWSEDCFEKKSVKLISGETTTMKLAEKGSFIGTKKDGIWVKEVRKLTKSGHQTSIVSTGYTLDLILISVLMFARWCQENFFNYMMQHFAIDLLADYNKKDVSETNEVISNKWRQLEKEKNSLNGKLKTKKIRFASFTLNPMIEDDTKKYKKWEQEKVELVEEIEILTVKLDIVKQKQANTKKHVVISELPENEQFKTMDLSKKNLVDVIKMVAYRAETAMANLITNENDSFSDARSLLQTLFITSANLIPDYKNNILNVQIHNLSTRALDLKLDKLIIQLNNSQMKYPGSDMILSYSRLGENLKMDSC